jgi:hypothetical protein
VESAQREVTPGLHGPLTLRDRIPGINPRPFCKDPLRLLQTPACTSNTGNSSLYSESPKNGQHCISKDSGKERIVLYLRSV